MGKKLNIRRIMREIALKILYQLEFDSNFFKKHLLEEQIKSLFSEMVEDAEIRKPNIKQAQNLIEGVINSRENLDNKIKEFSDNWDFERISLIELNILRIAIYEFENIEKIPGIVTINEAVELSKTYADSGSYRFINGILNSVKVSGRIQKF
ncbi:MAG: transcription antitermination factor NusB [Candidatus Muiribacteriota bacterium]